MTIEEIIKKIESEKSKAKESNHSVEGMLRLQEVASQYQGEYRLIWSDEILERLKNTPRKAMHLSGVPMIDDLLGGFREQMLIGIAAHSGHGKTAMGLWFIKQYERLNPVLIALEQSHEELFEQRTSQGQFVPHVLVPEQHTARVRPDWIEERVIEGIAKYNSRLFVIDHLGYVDPDKLFERDADHLRIERKLQSIKHIAKKWNVVIIILIQLTQLDESIPPSLINLKGSSAIRQECDKVIMVWRKNDLKGRTRIYANETLFSLQKNRWSGRNGNVGLLFEPETGDYKVFNDWVARLEEMARAHISADENF